MLKRKYATATFFPAALPQGAAKQMITDDMHRLVHRFRRCCDFLATERAELAAMSPERRQAAEAEIASILDTVEDMKYLAGQAAERVRLA